MGLQYSISPDGKSFPLPKEEEYKKEFIRLKKLVDNNRILNREIVVVLGLGFVGSIMAAVIADSVDERGNPNKFVIGMQRPSIRSFWKIPMINQGIAPVKADDPEVEAIVRRCATEKKSLTATFTYEALTLADVVIVDIQCDYIKVELSDVKKGYVDMNALEHSLRIIGEHISPRALVIIETTVPPGTTEQVAYPIIKKIFRRRGFDKDPLIAHSYERVMPGGEYVKSVRDFWRVCSGINKEAKDRVVKFLQEVINTKDYPLTIMERPIESETAKIVENSYRSSILAFLNEWSLFAEKNGVDIIKVIKAIKVRPTHSNIIFPGPGIGGCCLPKDGALGMWACRHILGWEDDIFMITPLAIDINDRRALHVGNLTRDALGNMDRPIAAAQILLLGASYKENVGDTRLSSSEIIVRRLTEMGAEIRVHDPYVEHWWEFEAQDRYPALGHRKAKFFRSQSDLSHLRVSSRLDDSLKGIDALIFAVGHKQYLNLNPDDIVRISGGPIAVIDCVGLLDDNKIQRYFELGCEVKGLGRGHVGRIKRQVRERILRTKKDNIHL